MRRAVFIVMFASLFAPAVAGANAAWTFGFKGGLNIAELAGDDADSLGTDSRTAFVGGLFLEGTLTDHFGVRFESLYAMKGATADFGPDADVTIRLDYIEFPMLLVLRTEASDILTLGAFAGPVVGFNANAEAEIEGTILGIPVSETTDLGDEAADFELGLTFGAGAAFKAGSIFIVADGRYSLGLTSVDDAGDDDVKNRAFALMVGLGFPLGSH